MTTPISYPNYTQGSGTKPSGTDIPVISDVSPTIADYNYPIGKIWINSSSASAFILTQISTLSGNYQANWQSTTYSSTGVQTITGNTGGAISPSSGNINVIGSGTISVAGSGSTLTISSTGSSTLTWNNNATTQVMTSNNGYIVTSATQQTFTLPSTAVVGDQLEIIWASGVGGWKIAQTAGQQIRLSSSLTTVGTGGSITSTAIGNTIHLICTTAGASSFWVADFSTGTLTPA